MNVVIALAGVGPGVQLEEALVHAGVAAKWDGSLADGPNGGAGCDVVVIDGDHLGARLEEVAGQWRDHPSVPGVVAVGASAVAREQAPRARVTLLSPTASAATLTSAIRDAAKLRLATGMRWPVLRAALRLPPADDEPAAWPATLLAARDVDLEIARSALRWHAGDYATPTARLDELRADRLLTVPELETIAHVDGTSTVQRLVRVGPLDPPQSARLLWTLVSLGAVVLTPEVHDVTTPQRRALAEIRAHLCARTARLGTATYYDVLEVTPAAEYQDIEAAYALVSARYSPQALGRFDLGALTSQITSTSALIEKARSVLVDHATRGRYHDWLRVNLPQLQTRWAIEQATAKAAAEAFARGQRALGGGDVHRAMGDLAMACRHHPGHPEYEANLAWARLRVQVASGRDQREAARAERATIEDILLGCRPWPRALIALALVCAAGSDADAARWHLHVALTIDPNVTHGSQLAQRLGMRR